MRVLLVRPPRRDRRDTGLCMPPLGLAYLAAVLLEAGHPVEILDAYALRWSWRRFEAELARRRPDFVGLTAMTPTMDVAARAVRLARPHARYIAIGGPHPTAVKGEIFTELPELDAAVAGEGEGVVGELLAWLEAGPRGAPPPGVLAPGAPFTEATPPDDLNLLPRPARHLLPNHRYRYLMATRPRVTSMVTSRGCPFACTFCDKSVGGSDWRARSPEAVVEELAHLVRDHQVGFVNVYDDNFTLRKDRVMAICEEILRRRIDIEWKCEARVEAATPELLGLMRRAGCRCIAYGVESANPESLRLLKKGTRVERIHRAFAHTRAAGIRSLAYVILGIPGEDAAAVQRSVQLCQDIRADYVQFSTLTAFPGTPLFAGAAARAASDAGVGATNPLDADLHRLTLSDLPPHELQALLRQAWMGFYLRPEPLLRLARDARTSGALDETVRMGLAMGAWALKDLRLRDRALEARVA